MSPLFISPIAMGRRPIAISEENARVNTQEGREP